MSDCQKNENNFHEQSEASDPRFHEQNLSESTAKPGGCCGGVGDSEAQEGCCEAKETTDCTEDQATCNKPPEDCCQNQ